MPNPVPEEIVRSMRKEHAEQRRRGGWGIVKQLARKYNLSPHTVHKYLYRKGV